MTLTGDFHGLGGGAVTIADGAVIDAGSGTIALAAANNIAVTGLQTTGSVTLKAGESTNIIVDTLRDGLVEDDETFSVTLDRIENGLPGKDVVDFSSGHRAAPTQGAMGRSRPVPGDELPARCRATFNSA